MFAVRHTALLACFLSPAALAGPAPMVQPGMWSTTITVIDVSGADMPPEAVAMMKGRPRTYTHCVTPTEAAQGARQMFAQGGTCKFSRFTMAGGHLDSAMTCPGSQMSATTTGTYTPSTYNATSKTVMSGDGGMTMTASVVGRRTGTCG